MAHAHQPRLIAAAAVLLSLAACDDPLDPSPADWALTGVTLIDGTGAPARPGQTLVIRDGVLSEIGDDGAVPLGPELERRALAGRWVMPGLVDTHAHMPDVGDQPAFLRTFLALGVTTARSTAAAPSGGVDLRARIEAGEILGPRFRTTGRLIDAPGTIWPSFGSVVSTEEEVRSEVRRQASQGVDAIKLYVLIPPDLLRAAVDEAEQAGLPVIGHLGRTSWGEGVAAGIDELTHSCFWGLMHSVVPLEDSARFAEFFTPNDAFDLGLLAEWNEVASLDAPRFVDLIDAAETRGVSLSPNLVLCEATVWGDDPTTLARLRTELDLTPGSLPHPYSAGWPADARTEARAAFETVQAMVAYAHAQGVRITTASDTRNPWMTPGASLHREMELLVDAGIPPLEVLRIATLNGAASLGVESETGSLEVGKQADLIVLSADPSADVGNVRRIELVVRAGIAYRPEDLLPD